VPGEWSWPRLQPTIGILGYVGAWAEDRTTYSIRSKHADSTQSEKSKGGISVEAHDVVVQLSQWERQWSCWRREVEGQKRIVAARGREFIVL
jgi:hypothetical protein